MANLRKKLQAISSRSMIKTVKGQGYIFLTSSSAMNNSA
ncbi:winged helix-turn-helix domain-containing protein [Colwellia psychrerythraea]